MADARWFFENALLGDVVEVGKATIGAEQLPGPAVKHSPKSLPIRDGLGDWALSFDRYGH